VGVPEVSGPEHSLVPGLEETGGPVTFFKNLHYFITGSTGDFSSTGT